LVVAEKYLLHRLGQEPPPQQQEDSYDGRSLAEVSISNVLLQTSRIHFLLLVSNVLRRNLLQIGYVSFLAIPSSIQSFFLDSKTGGMGGKN
jgi:hypothetical protein